MPTLLNMQDVALKHIMDKLDYLSVQCLRKVCIDLRQSIFRINPESTLSVFQLDLNCDSIITTLRFKDRTTKITYKKHETGCLMKWTGADGKIMQDSDHVEVALHDAHLLLDSKNFGALDRFSLTTENQSEDILKFMENFESYMKTRKNPLKVEYFSMHASCQKHLLNILPFVNPTGLQTLDMDFFKDNGEKLEDFVLDKIVKSDQWKNSKELHSAKLFLETPLHNFKHFKKVYIENTNLTIDMFEELKEAFLNPPHKDYCQIKFDHFNAEQSLIDLYGSPFLTGFLSNKAWFFGIDSENVLSVRLNSSFIVFNVIDEEEVPEGANIIL
ncbi:hypothetical protein L5515_006625 [Caenorhabditis briggsae]|uniref:DUF38 domain-containing protein n=1 Tax=Caenorhabditis briggsae TaxID=6238 RepID=A0AAE9JL47_CAEBR|nr:hypothetical protein L5515_006625 [Caenorhabditis briggsae]